ncbi:MAG: O-antigen ligase family protein [Prevotella sp.]|nr:O-antigen ligase family protein [Prevotella sp.]
MKFVIEKEKSKWLVLAVYLTMSAMGFKIWILGTIIFITWDILTNKLQIPIHIHRPNFENCQILFSIFIAISFFWLSKNVDPIITWSILIGAFSTIYFCSWLNRNLRTKSELETILRLCVYIPILCAIYASIRTPVDSLKINANLFLGDYGLGSHNTLGMLGAFAAAICVYFLTVERKRRLLYYICLFLELVITILAGSRKGFVGMAFCIGLYLILSSRSTTIIRNCVVAVSLVLLGYYFLVTNEYLYTLAGHKLQVFVKSFFFNDNIADHSIIERSYYRSQALSMFTQHPITGLGLDGFRAYMDQIGYSHVTYSHCNYTELLADYGIVGFILYYFYKMKAVVARFGGIFRKDNLHIFLWVIALTLLILEYGFVSYYVMWNQLLWVIILIGLTISSNTIRYE